MARGEPGLLIRLPTHVKEQLREAAMANRRSMNSEVLFRLEAGLRGKNGAAEDATSPRHEHAETLEGNSNDYANK